VTDFVLTLSCDDQVGIVHAVARFLAEHGSNIEDSQQYGDRATGRFFMRVHALGDADDLREAFRAVAEQFAMTWELRDAAVPGRVLVMVSQQGHCLNDLLYRRSNRVAARRDPRRRRQPPGLRHARRRPRQRL